MKHLVQQLGLIVLICLGVRVGAELVTPVLPSLLGLALVLGAVMWLWNRRGSGGFR